MNKHIKLPIDIEGPYREPDGSHVVKVYFAGEESATRWSNDLDTHMFGRKHTRWERFKKWVRGLW